MYLIYDNNNKYKTERISILILSLAKHVTTVSFPDNVYACECFPGVGILSKNFLHFSQKCQSRVTERINFIKPMYLITAISKGTSLVYGTPFYLEFFFRKREFLRVIFRRLEKFAVRLSFEVIVILYFFDYYTFYVVFSYKIIVFIFRVFIIRVMHYQHF